MVSNTGDYYFEEQIAQKIFKSMIAAHPVEVNAGLYMASSFKQSVSFTSELATNFGCYRFRIILAIVSQLLRTSSTAI